MNLQISYLNNIIINREYDIAFDANDYGNIQGIRATGEYTENLPSDIDGDSRYGILHTYLDKDLDGYQQYIPMNGSWENVVFKRRIKHSQDHIGNWQYVLDSTEWTYELNTENKTILGAINEINSKIQEGPNLKSLTFDTFSSVDNATEGCTSAGTLTTDLMASNGKSYITTTTTSAENLFTADFSDVKFGKYALCMRLKVNANTSSSAVLTARIFNGSSEILSKDILGTNFESTSNYCYICTTFDYAGATNVEKQALQLVLNTGTVNGIEVRFDYAYITLITPAVYI